MIVRLARYAALMGWTTICLGPIYWIAVTSLKGPHDLVYGPAYVPFLDFRPTLEAWRTILLDESETPRRFLNSIIVAVTATALTTTVAILAVRGSTRFRSAASDALIARLIAVRILPPFVLVVPLYLILSWSGLLDSRSVLAFVYAAVNLPVAIWLLRPTFGHRATEIEEAAQLDGASQLRILVDVLIPLLARPIAAVAVLILILCWNEYLLAAFLTADQAQTMPPYLAGLMSIREQQAASDPEEISRLAAATLLMIAPLIPLAGFVQRALRVAIDR